MMRLYSANEHTMGRSFQLLLSRSWLIPLLSCFIFLNGPLLAQNQVLRAVPLKGMEFYFNAAYGYFGQEAPVGAIGIRATIDEEGNCIPIRTVHSTDLAFELLLKDKLEYLKFYPAHSEFSPVRSEVTLLFYFTPEPEVPVDFSSLEEAGHDPGLFPEELLGPNSYLFYPNMPGWEDEKAAYIKQFYYEEPKQKQAPNDFVGGGNDEIEGDPGPDKQEDDDVDHGDIFYYLEKEPVPINFIEFRKTIGYPRVAVRNNLEGKVILRMLIDKKGNVTSTLLLRKNLSPILVEAVTSKILMLKFEPAVYNQKPVKVWVTCPFDFRLMN